MAPSFSKLVLKFWKLVSKWKYALTSRKYLLTPRKYALTPRKDFKIILLRDFRTIFGFMAHPPQRGFSMILRQEPSYPWSSTFHEQGAPKHQIMVRMLGFTLGVGLDASVLMMQNFGLPAHDKFWHSTDLLPTFWKNIILPSFIVKIPPPEVHQNWFVPLKSS